MSGVWSDRRRAPVTDAMREILDERCITLELAGKKKPEIIRELVDTLARGVAVSDPGRLTRELVDREKLTTTGIGDGIAIPHTLSATVDETAMAFGRKYGIQGTPTLVAPDGRVHHGYLPIEQLRDWLAQGINPEVAE